MSWQGFVDGFKRFFGFGKKEKTETTTERPNPVLEVAHAIKNADAVVSAPSYLGLGTPGLPALSREIVTSTLTPGQLEGIGHVAQNVAAKAAIGAKKIGLAKVAAKLAIVGTKSNVSTSFSLPSCEFPPRRGHADVPTRRRGQAAGGRSSLIPLMKLRFANPAHLVDLNFVPGTSYIREDGDGIRFGPMTRHAEIDDSAVASRVPIIHDCAAGIADIQVRNRGTIGGSLAEADPSGDWAPTLLCLETDLRCVSSKGERTLALKDFFRDAYTTALEHDELISEIVVKRPPANSGSVPRLQALRPGIRLGRGCGAVHPGRRHLPRRGYLSRSGGADGGARGRRRGRTARPEDRCKVNRGGKRSGPRRRRSSAGHARLG